ncbi:hypothetical protein EES39_06335 [Streptomyces sp. ADI92-24]|nr:hypothetical protein EES39_06335 [Streptomyces sp. ADI92-24]
MRTTVETWREGAHAGHTHEPNEVTIQLDGLGRQLSELLPEPGAPDGSDGPVFVDESGRRSKTLRRFGWVIAAVCVCFAVTLVGAVLGGNSSAPFLPLSGQDEHRKAEEVQVPPAPGESVGALVTPSATAGSSQSAPVDGSSAPVPGSSAAAGSSAPGAGSSPPGPVVPVGDRTQISGGDDTAPSAESSVSTLPTSTGTPPADPGTPPPDTAAPPVESSEPPVQEQEGAK